MTHSPKGNPAVVDTLRQRSLVLDVHLSFRVEDEMGYDSCRIVEEEVLDEVFDAVVWTVVGAVVDTAETDPPSPALQALMDTLTDDKRKQHRARRLD